MNEIIENRKNGCAKEPSQIAHWMNMLERELLRAEELESHIKNRLSTVMRKNDDEIKNDSVQDEIVPLAADIRLSVRRLDGILSSIQDMMNRVEL